MPTPPKRVNPIPNCKAPAFAIDYRTPDFGGGDPGKGDLGDFTVPPVSPDPFGETIAKKSEEK
jgi:hypothetical protein